MKRFLIALVVSLVVLFVVSPAFAGQDQKSKESTIISTRQNTDDNLQEAKIDIEACNITNKLACGLVLNIGKPIMYFPEDHEGCTDGPQGCKLSAEIIGIPTVFNAATGKFDFVRDSTGAILIHIFVKRPKLAGGSFEKDFVPWQTGRKGGARPLDPLDTRGIL